MVHALDLCLLVGRAAHAYGVSRVEMDHRFGVFGMAMTFTSLTISSLCLLYFYAVGWLLETEAVFRFRKYLDRRTW